MGNSKERRKARRQFIGVEPAAERDAVDSVLGQRPARRSDWKWIPKWMPGATGLTAVVVVLALYPWLAVREDSASDPSRQLKTSFFILNRGYVPITGFSARCRFTAISPQVTANFQDNDVLTQQFVDKLAHRGQVSIPCVEKIFGDPGGSIFQFESSASLEMTISYRLLGVLVHTPQQFRFRVEKTPDGKLRWLYDR